MAARLPLQQPAGVALFVYAQLCKGPARPHAAWGQLRELPGDRDAAARFGASYIGGSSVVRGQLLWVTPTELRELDKTEAPQWKRTYATLTTGQLVQAYAWAGDDAQWRSMPISMDGTWHPPTGAT